MTPALIVHPPSIRLRGSLDAVRCPQHARAAYYLVLGSTVPRMLSGASLSPRVSLAYVSTDWLAVWHVCGRGFHRATPLLSHHSVWTTRGARGPPCAAHGARPWVSSLRRLSLFTADGRVPLGVSLALCLPAGELRHQVGAVGSPAACPAAVTGDPGPEIELVHAERHPVDALEALRTGTHQ